MSLQTAPRAESTTQLWPSASQSTSRTLTPKMCSGLWTHLWFADRGELVFFQLAIGEGSDFATRPLEYLTHQLWVDLPLYHRLMCNV